MDDDPLLMVLSILIPFQTCAEKWEEAAKEKECGLIGQWQRSITNQLRWCVALTQVEMLQQSEQSGSLYKIIYTMCTLVMVMHFQIVHMYGY